MPDFSQDTRWFAPNGQPTSGNNTGTPSGQTAGMPSTATTNYLPWLQWALQGATSYANYSSAREANRKNVQLTREQMAWEERMANTAVQRRAADIEAAGGNRALAFTNGQEASTPNVAAPHVEATRLDPINIMSAKMMQAQLANINADTLEKAATARSKTVQARIDETGERSKTEYTVNHNVEAYEWDDLKTRILRNTTTSTAMEAKRLEETVDSVIRRAKQQAEKGQIDLDSLKALADIGGADFGFWEPILKVLTPFLLKMAD